MKRHSWIGPQCSRCGLAYSPSDKAVLFAGQPPQSVWVPLVDRKIPRCGENESQWRARLALKRSE
jgi:hypothetical protein